MLISLSVEESKDLMTWENDRQGWGEVRSSLKSASLSWAHELRFRFIIQKGLREKRGGGSNAKEHPFPQTHCSRLSIEESFFFPE